jgi:hypothetical protein
MEVKVMDNEIYSFALKNALNEVRNLCPDMTNAFMFNKDGEIIAGDEKISEKTVTRVVNAFDSMIEKADAIGDIEGIVLEGAEGRISISGMNSVYLLTVTSKKADLNYVNTVTRVVIPTVLKVLEKINPAPLANNPSPARLEPESKAPFAEELEETEELEAAAEMPLKETPVNQLIVENLGGLLVPSDTVRIDNEILSQWEELYEDKKIEEVEIETIDGKMVRCKARPIKDSKYEGKGVIQMPEKIQFTLEIKKGELVRARPVIESDGGYA